MWNQWNTPIIPPVATAGAPPLPDGPPPPPPSDSTLPAPSTVSLNVQLDASNNYCGYTPAQYAALTPEQQFALQQHWQQWQNYQQEYAKWHAQYGEQYKREMAAVAATTPTAYSNYYQQQPPPLPPPPETEKISAQPQIYSQSTVLPTTQIQQPSQPKTQLSASVVGSQVPTLSNPIQQQWSNYSNYTQPMVFSQPPPNFNQQPPMINQQPPTNFSQLPPPNFVQQPSNFPQQPPPNFAQQPPPNFNQQPPNFNQQTQNLNKQQPFYNQQTPNFNSQSSNFMQNSPNLNQTPINFNSKPPDINQLPPNFNLQPPNSNIKPGSQMGPNINSSNFGINQPPPNINVQTQLKQFTSVGEKKEKESNFNNRNNQEESERQRDISEDNTNATKSAKIENKQFSDQTNIQNSNSWKTNQLHRNRDNKCDDVTTSSRMSFDNNNQGSNNPDNAFGNAWLNNRQQERNNDQFGINQYSGRDKPPFGNESNQGEGIWSNNGKEKQFDRRDMNSINNDRYRDPQRSLSNANFGKNSNRWSNNDNHHYQGQIGVGQQQTRNNEIDEENFDRQFRLWEEQFEDWKKANVNHPDKSMYKRYEHEFEKQRQRIMERRDQMRLRKLELLGKKPSTNFYNNSYNQSPKNDERMESPKLKQPNNENEEIEPCTEIKSNKPDLLDETKKNNLIKIDPINDNQFEDKSNIGAGINESKSVDLNIDASKVAMQKKLESSNLGKRKHSTNSDDDDDDADDDDGNDDDADDDRPASTIQITGEVIDLDEEGDNENEHNNEKDDSMKGMFTQVSDIPGLDLVSGFEDDTEVKKSDEDEDTKKNDLDTKIPSLFDIVVENPIVKNNQLNSENSNSQESQFSSTKTMISDKIPHLGDALKDPIFMQNIANAVAKVQNNEKQSISPNVMTLPEKLLLNLRENQPKIDNDNGDGRPLSFTEWQNQKSSLSLPNNNDSNVNINRSQNFGGNHRPNFNQIFDGNEQRMNFDENFDDRRSNFGNNGPTFNRGNIPNNLNNPPFMGNRVMGNFRGNAPNFGGNGPDFSRNDANNYEQNRFNFNGNGQNFRGNNQNFSGNNMNYGPGSNNFGGGGLNFRGNEHNFTDNGSNFRVNDNICRDDRNSDLNGQNINNPFRRGSMGNFKEENLNRNRNNEHRNERNEQWSNGGRSRNKRNNYDKNSGNRNRGKRSTV